MDLPLGRLQAIPGHLFFGWGFTRVTRESAQPFHSQNRLALTFRTPMVAYWLIVLFPMLLALAQSRSPGRQQQTPLLLLLFVTLFVFMALRETGGDYSTYLELYNIVLGADLEIAMESVEPGYGTLTWVSGVLGLGIYGVNAACALIFLYCLYRAARNEQHPLLLVALAIPYFVIVVGIGYTRQGVAAALVLFGVVLIREGRPARATLAILLASTFHFSALAGLLLPLIATTHNKRGLIRNIGRLLMIPVLVISSRYLFSTQIDTYTKYYIEMGLYESGGAFLRSTVTGAAATLFFVLRRQFRARYDDYGIWRPFAILGLIAVPLSLVASTPVDRLGLYLIPFQLVIFARLPVAFAQGHRFQAVKFMVLAAYLLYFFVWLHLGSYSQALWVPYRWLFSGP